MHGGKYMHKNQLLSFCVSASKDGIKDGRPEENMTCQERRALNGYLKHQGAVMCYIAIICSIISIHKALVRPGVG